MEIPYALRGDREIQVERVGGGEYRLRHPWLAGAPRWTFAVLLLIAAGAILFICGWPSDRDAAAFEAGLLAVVAYPLAALCYNATTLIAGPEGLRWSYGPLPWKAGGRLRRQQITGFTYGRILRTVSAEEAMEEMRSGHLPRPRYGVTLRTERWPRERRVFDLIGDEATAGAAARFLSELLGDLPVEHRTQADRSRLPDWAYGLMLLGVLAFIGLLLFSAFSEGP